MKLNGFTLIELLIAISIIGVLSTIGLTVYKDVTLKARDGIRKSDLRNLSTGLELYFQKNGKYIEGSGSCEANNAVSDFENQIKDYLSPSTLPKDPKEDNPPYCYEGSERGLTYALYAKLENCNDPGITAGINCATARYNFLTAP